MNLFTKISTNRVPTDKKPKHLYFEEIRKKLCIIINKSKRQKFP